MADAVMVVSSRVEEWLASPEGDSAEAVRERTLRAQAREWVDRVNAATGMSGGWRLQAMSLRTRRDYRWTSGGWAPAEAAEREAASDLAAVDGSGVYSSGSASASVCPELPARVRRFVAGCPWPILDHVVRYLYLVAPYSGIVFNGVASSGVYRPTLTQWTRDSQSQTDSRRTGGDATYTLVQDLVEVTRCRDELADLATGSSCLQVETTTYRWDEPSVEGADLSCGQGVTRSVQAVRRNEDGTFDYQLVTARARTRHVPAHAVSCDAAHSATEERWENLYGGPGSFRASGSGDEPAPCGDVPLAGLPPESCSSTEAGVRTAWEVQLNRDCTYSVSRRVVEANRLEAGWADGTSCRGVVHEEVRGSPAPPAPAPPAAGQRVDMRVSVDDDGSWSWSKSVSTAPGQERSEWYEGSPVRRRTTVHVTDVRSRPDAEALLPSARVVGRVVEARLSRNDDCTWDVSWTKTEAPAPERAEWESGSPCRPSEHRRVMDVATLQAAKSYVHARADGYVVQAQLTRKDDGTWDVESTRTKSSAQWSAEWEDGSPCRPRENLAAAGLASLALAKQKVHRRAAGYTVQASVRMSEDCTWEVTSSKSRSSREGHASWTSGTPCRPVAETRDWGLAGMPADRPPKAGETVSRQVSLNEDCTWDDALSVRTRADAGPIEWMDGAPGVSETEHVVREGLAAVPEVEMADGAVTRASIRRDEDCTYSSEVSVTRTPPAGPESWYEGSSCRPVAVEAWWGQARIPPELEGVPEAGHDVSASVQRNADGTFDAVRRDRFPNTGGSTPWIDGGAAYSAEHTLYSHVASVASPGRGGAGTVTSASFSRGEDCTYSGTVSRRTSVPWSDSWQEGSSCAPVSVQVFDHSASRPSVGVSSNSHVRASFRREDDGTYSGEIRRQTSSPDSGAPLVWRTVEKSPTHEYTYRCTLRVFSHVKEVPVPSTGSGLSVSVRLEDDCTYSGTIATRELEQWAERGSGSGSGSREYTKKEYAVVGAKIWGHDVKYRVHTEGWVEVVNEGPWALVKNTAG